MVAKSVHDFEAPPPGPAWQAAAAYGCDMDLLAESLALTPAARLRFHTIAVRRVERLEAAMSRARHGSRPFA